MGFSPLFILFITCEHSFDLAASGFYYPVYACVGGS